MVVLAKKVVKFFVLPIAAIEAVLALLSLVPRISIEPQTQEPSIVFPVYFKITNESAFPLYEVSLTSCRIRHTELLPNHNILRQVGMEVDDKAMAKRLRPHETATGMCRLVGEFGDVSAETADIEMLARYKVFPVPLTFRGMQRVRFEGSKDPDGIWRWHPRALEETATSPSSSQ